MQNKLPETWQEKILNDVCKIYTGNSINEKIKKEKYLNLENGYNYIATKDIGFDSVIDYENGVKIPFEESKFRIAPINTTLLCIEGGSAGRKIGLIDQPVCFVNKLCAFVPNNQKINYKFLYYFLQSDYFKKIFLDKKTGLIGGVSTSKLKELNIYYPSIKEQERIVGILDEVFENIEQAKKNAEQNLQNAKELFENVFYNLFSTSTNDTVKLFDVCAITSNLIDPKMEQYQNLLHIGAGNIMQNSGEICNLLTAKDEKLISNKFKFDNKMVLYSKIRPYLRKVVRPDFCGICSADIYPLLPNEKYITRDFLYYLLLSKQFTNYAILGSARAGMPKVNRPYLFAFEFNLPSIQEQKQIVAKLDNLQKQVKSIEVIYEQKTKNLEELKQSILQKAFNGEL